MRWLRRQVWLLALFVWLFALMWKVQTYVSGQDPSYYISLARTLLDADPGSPQFRAALLRVAPGFPVMLAGIRYLAGPFAPYWVNLAWACLFFACLASVVRKTLAQDTGVGVVLLTTAVVVFLGYGLNTHFLLYLFRGMSACALAMLGFWVLIRGGDTARGCGLAGLCLLGAVSVREPMIVAWLAGLGWIVESRRGILSRPGGRGTRQDVASTRSSLAVRVGAFVTPLALAVATVSLLFGSGLSSQAARISSWFLSSPGVLLTRVGNGAASQCSMLFDELTPVGLLLIGLGACVHRKTLLVRWCLLAPAAGLFTLYSFLPPHRRYLLSVLMFLAPIAGLGVHTAITFCARDNRAVWLRGATCLLCLPLLWHLYHVQPWGPKVTRTDVVAFVGGLEQAAAPGDGVVLEHACRHAADAIASFSHARQLVDEPAVSRAMAMGRSVFYLRPVNEQAFYSAPTRFRPRINLYGELQNRFHLTTEGDIASLQIADGSFDLLRVTPWTRRLVRNEVSVVRNQPAFVWLDLGGTDPDAPKTIRIRSERGTLLKEWTLASGNGFVVLGLSRLVTRTQILQVEVESSALLPDEIVDHVALPGHASPFLAGHGMSWSARTWFQSDLPPQIISDRSVMMFARDLVFYPPPMLGEAGRWEVLFQCSVTDALEESFRLVSDVSGESARILDVDPPAKRFWNSFVVPLSDSVDTPPVRIRAEGLRRGLIRIHALRFQQEQVVPDS